MVNSPYAPPTAAISEVEVPGLPRVTPAKVRRAVVVLLDLLWIGPIAYRLVLELLHGKAVCGVHPISARRQPHLSNLDLLKPYKGRNCAGVLILVTTMLGMLSVLAPPVWKMMAALPLPSRVILLMKVTICSYALSLVFTSPGKEWFRKHIRNSFRLATASGAK